MPDFKNQVDFPFFLNQQIDETSSPDNIEGYVQECGSTIKDKPD